MSHTLTFTVNRATESEITQHLLDCDAGFTPPLSRRLDVREYGSKIVRNAVRFEAWSERTLAGLVAVYCNDVHTRVAYVTSVSVLPAWQGRGIAGRLMQQCVEYAQDAGMQQVSLEVARSADTAVRLYERAGFTRGEMRGDSMMMHLTLTTGEGRH